MKRQRITPAYKARRVQRERRAVFVASIRAICSENMALAERIRSLQVESTLSAERASIAAGGPAVIFNLIDRDAPVIDRAREPLLPPDAAAAVEENFGRLDPTPPTPFEPIP